MGEVGVDDFGMDKVSANNVDDESSRDKITKNGNDFTGIPLMSEYNKQNLRNNLIRQLMKDAPYSEDYYYLTTAIRKANEAEDYSKTVELLGKLYPKIRFGQEDDEQVRSSAFTQDELMQSLGSLKISKGHGPKPVMDPEVSVWLADRAAIGTVKGDNKNGRDSKYGVHQKIEKLYQALLLFEETKARLSIMRYNSGYDKRSQEDALGLALSIMSDEELLKKIFTVGKGLVAVCRWLVHIKVTEGTPILASLLCHLPKAKLNPKQTKQVYKSLQFRVTELTESCFEAAVKPLNDELIDDLLRTTAGISAILLLLDYGSSLYFLSKSDAYKKEWVSFFQAVTERFAREDMETAIPLEFSKGYLERLKKDPTAVAPEYVEYWIYLMEFFASLGCIIKP